jgi:hypothetical protein
VCTLKRLEAQKLAVKKQGKPKAVSGSLNEKEARASDEGINRIKRRTCPRIEKSLHKLRS